MTRHPGAVEGSEADPQDGDPKSGVSWGSNGKLGGPCDD